MAGPWEQYQAAAAEPEPQEPWKQFQGANPPVPNSYLESGLRGAEQGATFGLSDELRGAAGAVKDVTGDNYKLSDLVARYRVNRDQARAMLEQARQDNPKSYAAGEITGGIGTSFIPGLNALNAGKAATALGGLGRAAASGALAGYGLSDSPTLSGDIQNAEKGAAIGGAVHGALGVAGNAISGLTPTNISKKLANVFLNTPEDITETYIKNPQAVREAPRMFELAQKTQGLQDQLKRDVIEGSAASRQILADEGQTVSGSQLADIFKQKADDIQNRSEGVIDDPQKEAAYNWLRSMADKYKGATNDTGATKDFSTNRVKDLLQSIDNQTNWQTQAGQFSPISDNIRKDVRGSVDQLLKGQSPAYTQQMGDVAKDAQLLKNSNEVFSSPQSIINALRRVNSDQYGSGQLPRDTIQQFGERTGEDLLGQAKLSAAREAFDKSITNGSMNVNKFSKIMEGVPGGSVLGPLLGASVDKYGRKLTMNAVDSAAALSKAFNESSNTQKFLADVQPLVEAAKSGNKEAILTFQLLSQSNPNALKALDQGGNSQ